jgi:subtilase family serine protease
MTVAIVDAFGYDNAEADLAVFRSQYGLAPCTTANGCFTKEASRGSLPPYDEGWAIEASLDVQLVHAIAPGAKILLVEASSNSVIDLYQAFQYATQRAAYVTSSWGSRESLDFDMHIFDPLFQVPGVSDFFATGDLGTSFFSFPGSHPDVIGVGGTRLELNSPSGHKRETGWSGSGGGCSIVFAPHAAQAAFAQYPGAGCAGYRAGPDIAANAEPATGYAIYARSGGVTSWLVLGGTSASTPVMAARAATTGLLWDANFVYSTARSFFDVKVGNNGAPAGPGFDLVTGRGRYGA